MPYSILASTPVPDGGGGGGSLGTLLLLPVMVAVMYFLLIRPQRKRQREMTELQSNLEVGDEITMTSGIYGFITGVEDKLYWVEIDDDVQIRVAKGAIAGRVTGDDSSTDSASGGARGSASSKVNKPKGSK